MVLLAIALAAGFANEGFAQSDRGIPHPKAVKFERMDFTPLDPDDKALGLDQLTDADRKTADELLAAVLSTERFAAEGKMINLERQPGKPEDVLRLTRIAISIAPRIEQAHSEIPEDKRTERVNLLGRYEMVLDRCLKPNAISAASGLWIARRLETAAVNNQSGGRPTPESRRLFGKAAEAYKLVQAHHEKQAFVGTQAVAQAFPEDAVTLRRVVCLVHTDQVPIDWAFKQLDSLYGSQPHLLELQVTGCELLERVGNHQMAVDGYTEEQRRASRRGDYHHWGWQRLSDELERSAPKDPELWPFFYEATFRLNYGRFVLAMANQDGQAKREGLAQVDANLLQFAARYPDLGGGFTQKKYQKLFNDVRMASNTPKGDLATLGKQELANLEARAAAARKAAEAERAERAARGDDLEFVASDSGSGYSGGGGGRSGGPLIQSPALAKAVMAITLLVIASGLGMLVGGGPMQNEAGETVLRYGKFARGLSAFFGVLGVGCTVAALGAIVLGYVTSSGDRLMVLGGAAFFLIIGVYLVVEMFRVKLTLGADGLTYENIMGRQTFIAWEDLREVNPYGNYVQLKGVGKPILVNAWVSGWDLLGAECRSRIPNRYFKMFGVPK
jgi:hypothetical protein